MIKINLYVIGSIKEKYMVDEINEYLKRLSKYAKVNIIEFKECKIQGKDCTSILEEEGNQILKKIEDDEYLFLLDLHGKIISSEEFASNMKSLIDLGKGKISFAIGGTLGVSDALRKRANFLISLSKMTFTHQMTRVIILEQIYRAFKINNNEQYHH